MLDNHIDEWLTGRPKAMISYLNDAHHLTGVEAMPTYVRITDINNDEVETDVLFSKEQAHPMTVERVNWDNADFVRRTEIWSPMTLQELLAEGYLRTADDVPQYVDGRTS